MKPLVTSDMLHLEAAQGWLALGIHLEARAFVTEPEEAKNWKLKALEDPELRLLWDNIG